MNPQPLIEFQHVSKRFGANQVLRDASFSIYRGEITTIIGKSGVGKSVLLKHIIGLMEQDEGRILYQGKALQSMTAAERRETKRKFSYMFQETALFDSMTVYENIALPLEEKTALPKRQIRQRVQEKLQQLDLQKIDGRYPSQLSGGMKKRVALARALVTEPEIVLFDEPTTGLDPIRKNAVHSMISEYQHRFGFTGVIVSHEIPEIFYITQRVAMLDLGHIVFEGSPDEILESQIPEVRQFVMGIESRHDELTGMKPMYQGARRFQEERERIQHQETAFSMIVLTIRNMEEINTALGHERGQAVLRSFAANVQKQLRITDTCSRYGMNKIMVLLPNTDMDQSSAFCENLAREMNGNRLLSDHPEHNFCFSVSAGFAEAAKDSRLEEVMAAAESNQSIIYEFSVC